MCRFVMAEKIDEGLESLGSNPTRALHLHCLCGCMCACTHASFDSSE